MNASMIGLRMVLIGLTVASALSASAESAPKPVLEKFPITAWGQPALTEADLKAYQAAHFNIVQAPAAETDAIRKAGALGFRVMLTNPQGVGAFPADWASHARSFENVMGWALGNAVTTADAPKVAAWVKELRTADPQRWALASVPPSDSGSWGATLGDFLRAGMPAITVQRNNWRADGTDDAKGFFEDLEAARQISSKLKTPIWGMIQVVRCGTFRWASDSDIRVQVYSYLAAGAKGLCYLTQWPSLADLAAAAPDEGEEARDGAALDRRKQYELDSIARVNQEVLTLAPSLLGLRSTGMYFVGGDTAGLPQLRGSGQLISAVTAEVAMVGMLSDGQGNTWAMLVNGRHGKQKAAPGQMSSIRVVVDARVKRVLEMDRITAYPKEVPLDKDAFFVSVPGGTGCLLRLETNETAPK